MSRFTIEIAEGVAGLTGSGLMTIPALAVLVALQGVFSPTGYKPYVVVALPSRVLFLSKYFFVGSDSVGIACMEDHQCGDRRYHRWCNTCEVACWAMSSW